MKTKTFLLSILLISCSQKDIHINNARRFINQWNYDRALIEILKYREDKNAEIQYLLGICYFGKNEYDQAKDYFRNSLQIDTLFRDSIINIYTISAKKALKISDLKKVLQFYKTIAELVPDYKQIENLFLVADLNFQQGNYPGALAGYMKAYEIDSTSETARKSIKNFLKSLIECESLSIARIVALREYKRAKTSENLLLLGEVNFLLGKKYYDKGQFDSATVYFKEVVTNQEPKSLLDDACFYLGEISYTSENYAQAMDYYKKVLRLNPYQKGEFVQKSQERIKEIKEKQ
uniref:Tetratricopeptide repeat protein n=1 Tax=candidate division WOR-3 bacterium TaxID=2052148 RepID=A0A7V0Z7I2_UNCW3